LAFSFGGQNQTVFTIGVCPQSPLKKKQHKNNNKGVKDNFFMCEFSIFSDGQRYPTTAQIKKVSPVVKYIKNCCKLQPKFKIQQFTYLTP
jgi:hypothetical protein